MVFSKQSKQEFTSILGNVNVQQPLIQTLWLSGNYAIIFILFRRNEVLKTNKIPY